MNGDTKVVVDLSSGEAIETRVPLDAAELKQRVADAATPVAAPVEEAVLPAGVVGWPCAQYVGATCAHPACAPPSVASAIGSPA